jgi:UDP-N-acetylmuramate--alanine ligase
MNEFGDSLKGADEILLTEIYAAGEEPLPGITGEALQRVVQQRSGRPVRFVKSLDDAVTALAAVVRPGDAVITLGAGSIGTLPRRILDALGQEGRLH